MTTESTAVSGESRPDGAESHRAEIRIWGDPNMEQYVVLCHVDGCGFRSPGGLGSKQAGDIQYRHWLDPNGGARG